MHIVEYELIVCSSNESKIIEMILFDHEDQIVSLGSDRILYSGNYLFLSINSIDNFNVSLL